MKNLITFFVAILLLSTGLMAQTPTKGFKYQAIARDNTGQVLMDRDISIRISIIKGEQNGSTEFSEIHTVTTNKYGLFSLHIGIGGNANGDFEDVDWGSNKHFLRIEMDANGGNDFFVIGTSELLSVPYALHAETVKNPDDADADPVNEIQDLTISGNNISITGNSAPTSIDLSQYLDDTDDQVLTFDSVSHKLTLQDGGTVDLSDLVDSDPDPTNEWQKISRNGLDVTLSLGGGTVSIADDDNDPVNELQTISRVGDTITLSEGGGSVIITDGDVDPVNEIQDIIFDSNNIYISENQNPTVIDLNPFMDNTDNQNLSSTYSGTNVTIDIANGTGTTFSIADNDNDDTNELISTATLNGTDLEIADAGGTKIIDLSQFDDSGTDDQSIGLSGNTLSIEDGNSVDLTTYLDNTDAQVLSILNDTVFLSNGGFIKLPADLVDDADANPNNEIQDLQLAGDNLTITNNGSATTIDLSPYMDNTDTQDLSSTVVGTNVTVDITDGTSASFSVADNDNDDTNELISTAALNVTDLEITDAGGTKIVDLSSLIDDADADVTNEIQDLQLAGNDLVITNNGSATTIDLTPYLDDTDDQTISITGDSLSIADGNKVDLSGYLDSKWNETGNDVYVQGKHVAIGTNSPNSHAALDVDVTDGAVLFPRLSTVQRNALTPEKGMVVYNTDEGVFQGHVSAYGSVGVDQQQTSWNSITATTTGNPYQTFIAGQSGILSKVELNMRQNSIPGTVSISLRDGDGNSGTILGSSVGMLINTNGLNWYDFNLNGVDVVSGNVYTIEVIGDPEVLWNGDNSNPYAGGYAWNGSSQPWDFMFRTNVVPLTSAWTNIPGSGSLDNDSTNEIQSLSLVGNSLSITSSGSVDLSGLVDDADANSSNELQTLSQVGNNVTLSNGGGTISIADNDDDSSNEIQIISRVGNVVSLSKGGGSFVDNVSDSDDNAANELQTLSLIGNNITISSGNSIDISSFLDNTDSQTLTVNGDSLGISGGNTIAIDTDNTNELQNLTHQQLPATDQVTVKITDGTNTTFSIADIDADTTNEVQSVSIVNDSLNISDGNTVAIPFRWDENGSDVNRASGNVGIGVVGPTSKLDVNGDVEIGTADAFYLGDPTTDGSWRIVRSGNDLAFERRETGAWVSKGTFNP